MSASTPIGAPSATKTASKGATSACWASTAKPAPRWASRQTSAPTKLAARRGVRVFCQPANAYQQGRQGYAYTGVCPADLERAFLASHGEGMVIFNLEFAVQQVVGEIASINYAIEDAERRIAKANIALNEDKELTTERRRRLREDIEVLSREIGRMEGERDRLLVELGARETRLRDHVGGRGY